MSPGATDDHDVMEQLITSYSDEELIPLALWFTLVKVLYVKGTLGVLPRLTSLLGNYDVPTSC